MVSADWTTLLLEDTDASSGVHGDKTYQFSVNTNKTVGTCTADTDDTTKVNCSEFNTHFDRNWTTEQPGYDLQFASADASNYYPIFGFIRTSSDGSTWSDVTFGTEDTTTF